jgi:hypothetical protein
MSTNAWEDNGVLFGIFERYRKDKNVTRVWPKTIKNKKKNKFVMRG